MNQSNLLSNVDLANRKQAICATDSAALLNMHPYKTALDVYLDKTSPDLNNADINLAARLGQHLEPFVLQLYVESTNAKITRPTDLFLMKKYPNIGSHIDAYDETNKCLVEAKTTSAFLRNQWGDDQDDIPVHYIIQCAHESMVFSDSTGQEVEKVVVPVLIGQDFRIYEIKRDPELEQIILKNCTDFWENNVKKLIPPTPKTAKDVMNLYSRAEPNKICVLNNHLINKLQEIKTLKITKKQIEEHISEIEAEIYNFATDSEILQDVSGKTIATIKNYTKNTLNTNLIKTKYSDIYIDCLKATSYRMLKIKE
ncbi:MAG: hypothetical protein EKK56_00850 [Flavobacteriaceae bacterium]|nr:MAG: hypothetical protein EKK56_00850 [Flavobacteriaceae bacterium]